MEQSKSTFGEVFSYMYYLMLSADKVADMSELELGNKIMSHENLNKGSIMKVIDDLSGLSRESVYENGVALIKTLSREHQLKILGYLRLIARVDGSFDENESNLLSQIGMNELNISLQEIADKEVELKKEIS